MSWTIKGAQMKAGLISLSEMSKLHAWIISKDRTEGSWRSGKEISKDKLILNKDIGGWLKAGLAALYGPHQNRLWTKLFHALACETLEI